MTVSLQWREMSIMGGVPISTSLTEAETAQLMSLAAGREVLEIGSAFGYSTIAMALAGAAHVTSIDPHTNEDSFDALKANIEAYGVVDKITTIEKRSLRALPQLITSRRSFGLAFIDGDHRYNHVRYDVSRSMKMLERGGWVACHDYGEADCPGVKEACDELFPRGPTTLTDTLFQWAKP